MRNATWTSGAPQACEFSQKQNNHPKWKSGSVVFENRQMNQHHADVGHQGVSPQVVVLKMCHEFMKNYSYLVVDSNSRQAVVVDPAWQMEKIDQALAHTQAKLSGVLITHSHPDHIHLAEPIAETYGCPIWM